MFVFWWHHMFSQESHEQCVQWIVRFIHSQHSPKRIAFLYDCLAMAVETSLLTPRLTTLIHTSSCFKSHILQAKIYTFAAFVFPKGLCVEHSLVLKVWSGRELSCGPWPSNWFVRLSEGLTTRYFPLKFTHWPFTASFHIKQIVQIMHLWFLGHSRPPKNNTGQNPDHSYGCQLGHRPAAFGCQRSALIFKMTFFLVLQWI